jgi:ABC-type phosphate transport system substrate-binding protein
MKRKTMASTLAIAMATSAVSLVAMPAFATPSTYDTFDGTAAATSSPVDAIVGVGSDTTEIVTHGLAQAWNTSHSPKLSSFAATGPSNVVGDQIFLRTNSAGSIARPNGSGSGKNLLHGATNNSEIDFARSSSTLSATESSDGLKQFAFAVDGLKMAVANTTNAPASLTPAQIVDIYKGLITNWSDVGGTAGTIKPLIPQSGSGTRSFFQGRLDAANGGAVTLSGGVVTTQEHSVVDIQGDPNAIGPFSTARAKSNTATIKLLSGTDWKRAVYHVVRGADVADPDITAIFGKTGFVCSADGRAAITAAGFDPIAAYSQAGPCGVATSSAVTDLRTYDEAAAIGTTTTLAGTSTGPAVKLTATVTGNNTAGTVTFKEGDTTLPGGPVDVVAGKAVLDLAGVSLGSHTYSAQFTPEDPILAGPSIGDTTVVVKKASVVTLSLAPVLTGIKSYFGKQITATANVKVDGVDATSGTVRFTRDGATVKSVAVTNGTVSALLPATTTVGLRKIRATYTPTAEDTAGSFKEVTWTVLRAPSSITATLAASTIHSTTQGKVLATVKITTGVAPGIYATGATVRVFEGTRALATGTLSSGKATVLLPRLSIGQHRLTTKFLGTTNVSPSTVTSSVVLTVVR